MISRIPVIIISSVCFLAILLWCLHGKYYYITYCASQGIMSVASHDSSRRTIRLWMHTYDGWKSERADIMWSDTVQQAASYLAVEFIRWYQEESPDMKKFSVNGAIVGYNRELFISFDRIPFAKQNSCMRKLFFIESIIRTIREALLPVDIVYFLVNHQPFTDAHLAIEQPWPVTGFME